MPNGNETETETGEEKAPETPQKTAAEVAAEERAAAAEAAAAEAKAEAERLKAQQTRNQQPTGYTISSFSEQEWADAEQATGKDRKAILTDLNAEIRRDQKMREAVGSLQASLAVKEEFQEALDSDPMSPRFRAESKKFLADVPMEMMSTPEGRKKWIGKAIEFGKRSVKAPSGGRAPDKMDTTETGKGKDKGGSDGEFSVEEKEVIESHGRTVEDYKKIKHPVLKDGIMIRARPEEPRFGAK